VGLNPSTIGSRIAAWWGAWQYVVMLALLLLASLAGNVWQWKRALTAPLRAEVAGLKQAQEDTRDLLTDSRASATRLQAAADKAANQLSKAGKAYGAAVRATPLTTTECAPGQGRMDATNQALGQ